MTKKILGRVDKIDFPKLNLFDIDVKIDTGAYTSAIHCSKIIEENSKVRKIMKKWISDHEGEG